MKIAILLISLLAITFAQDACRVFKCGTIASTEGPQTCVRLAGTNATNAEVLYTTAKCSAKDETCQAWKWATPADANTTATCGSERFPATWPAQFVAENAAGKDGDICENTANCFTSASNNATCTSGICTASTTLNSACTATDDCPRAHYCPADTLVCTKLVADGANCTSSAVCGFRRSCIQLSPDTSSVCVAWATKANGDQFTRPNAEASSEANADLTASDVCASGFETTIGGTVQCRSGERNQVQGRDALAQTDNSKTCMTYRYTNDTLEGYSTTVSATTNAMCGFNKDNRAWCPLLRGDDEVVNTISAFVKAWNTISCHKNSGSSDGSVCKAQRDAQDTDAGWGVFQLLVQTSDPQSFANTAFNDGCVANTVMANFWQGHFTSAYRLSAVTSFFVLIASLIY